MAEDAHLADLVEAVAETQRHHIAVVLANSLKSINAVEGPTAHERGEAEAAEVACRPADKALEDYRATKAILGDVGASLGKRRRGPR